MKEQLEVVGIAEIAERLGVERRTAVQWKWRGLLPDNEWTVSGHPAWRWSVIEAWALSTGRAPSPAKESPATF